MIDGSNVWIETVDLAAPDVTVVLVTFIISCISLVMLDSSSVTNRIDEVLPTSKLSTLTPITADSRVVTKTVKLVCSNVVTTITCPLSLTMDVMSTVLSAANVDTSAVSLGLLALMVMVNIDGCSAAIPIVVTDGSSGVEI